MRIRRENKGKDIIINSACVIEAPDINQPTDWQVNSLMENYGIPLSVEMMTRMVRSMVTDFKQNGAKDKKYAFTLVCQDVTEDN